MLKVKGIHLIDRIQVPSKRVITDAGQMHVPCKFARTGAQLYTASQLGLVDKEPNEIITVLRDEKDVFAEDSVSSFRSSPVTLGHPKDTDGKPIAVTAANAKELQVGMLEGMPTRDEDTLGGVLVLSAKEAIDALEEGTQELSAGYVCDIEEFEGAYYQRNIRANHIAIVPKGRAGSSCRISDEAILIADEEVLKSLDVDLPKEPVMVDEHLLTDAQAKIVELTDAAAAHAETVKALQDSVDVAEIALETVKLELADAKVAAEEGVVERCEAIENARLIADMRDLGSKSVAEIKQMVVEDQMPERDLTGKSEPYIAAMFDLLVDQAKGTTPMSKILSKQASLTIVDAKPAISKAMEARAKMITRQSGK